MEKTEERDFKTIVQRTMEQMKIKESERQRDFRSEQRKLAEALEMEIYSQYVELSSKPNSSKVEVCNYLAQKFGKSVSAIYAIRKRVEERIKSGSV